MKLVATSKRDLDSAVLDPWSAVHLGSGLATGLVGVTAKQALFVSLAYDVVFSLFFQRRTGLLHTTGDEVVWNKLADVAIFMTGNYMGRKWLEKP